MHEAIILGSKLADLLNAAGFRDGGADYAILVTDTAGSHAEVEWDAELGGWRSAQGFDRDRLLMRLDIEAVTPTDPTPEQCIHLSGYTRERCSFPPGHDGRHSFMRTQCACGTWVDGTNPKCGPCDLREFNPHRYA
jgi:hypothetical protein